MQLLTIAWALLASWAFSTAGFILFSAAAIDPFVLKVAAANLLPHTASAVFLLLGRAFRPAVTVLTAGIALSFIITAWALADTFFIHPDAQSAFIFMSLPILCAAPVLLAGAAALFLWRFGRGGPPAGK